MKITEIMSLLDSLGASPRKSLGQNFLHDKNLASWIVEKLEIDPRDHVLEVGPGLGALTEQILLFGVSATLLEKDRAFAKYLREKFDAPKGEVIEGDALDYDTRADFVRQPVKVIGNLPYYVSSAILFHFTSDPCPYERMLFTVQREMADRLSAGPGTKEYGSLSAIVQRRWRVARLKTLPPSVFLPQPQVDSAVVLLDRRKPRELEETDATKFSEIVKAGFSERRKQVRKLLTRFETADRIGLALGDSGLPLTVRAEDISLNQWIRIANILQPVVVYGSDPNQLLTVVDENDEPVVPRNRATIHRDNLLHRAVHILLLNSRGELLLQKRSYRKDRFPGCWDSSASGHVDAGESYAVSAARELEEEIGATADLVELARVPASSDTGHEFIQIYGGSHDGPFHWNSHEIETGGFFALEMIDRWIKVRPADFAPAFVECYLAVREALATKVVTDPHFSRPREKCARSADSPLADRG
ncbi:MAG TPA: 16S rRNA (adenine(1518)-N(6)/adenine(1519)-N(6))-dimethyltransferase RsmA [Chthoniobacterales bacterium]|nr:16S rRNA (adenine(1518)-N(6)/adenine(1519)-N(6))-dimethyltransferase RsmA [Chthoniobacterales bacterium]